MDSKFSGKEALSFGWNTFKANFGFLFSLFLGIAVIYLGLAALQGYADDQDMSWSILVSFADWILRLLISIGLIQIPLMILDGKKPEYGHLFSGYRYLINYFVGSLVYMLIVICGLILLVVPGVIWAMRFQFFGYYIVDKNMKPIEALKASWAATAGQVLPLFTFSLLLALINIAGALALMIGLTITAPISLLAMAFVYRKLAAQATQPASVSASQNIA